MSDAKTLSLDEMIAQDRRAKASELASAMMGKNRNQNQNQNQNVPTGPAKLNGRGGINKRISSGSGIGNAAPATGLNGKWTHDLHQQNNPSRVSKLPTTLSPAIARSLQNNRLFAALHGTPTGPSSDLIPSGPRNGAKPRNTNIRGQASGFSIKGSAGPFVVQASNFAPGTTAEDIKMAMLPLGKILSCIILAANPTVICEIVFEKKEAADLCISQYNNQLADGRLLHLSMKPGPPVSRLMHQGGPGPRPAPRPADPNAQREEADRQRRLTNISFQDGSYGVRPPPLYSDALVQRGRGFNGGSR